MRLMPHSMGGQLIALLLLALLVAHVAAIWARQERDEGLHPLASRYMLDRIAGAYHAARLSTSEQPERIANAVSANGARFWIAPTPHDNTASMTKQEVALARDLVARFTEHAPPRIRVQVTDTLPVDDVPGVVDDPPRIGIYAALELPDGRWLSSFQQSAGRSPWWRPLVFSVPVSTLPVLLVAVLFIRRILRPIRALESAAERISRGEQGGPLPVAGPREARELTAAFNLMEERQRRFVEDRTRMLAAISHDLRTPITSLRLRVEMIDDVDLRMAMTRTLENMRLMVEETLRFSREDSVDEAAREVDLAELAQEVAAEITELGHPVAWSGPETMLYRCRPLAIRRALTNLLDNAVRHGTEVSINMCVSDTSNEVVIEVRDNGPGIEPALIARAFEPFVRLDSARNQATGRSGLGLSIVRSCIQAHGGWLQLINRPEGGLVGHVVLPQVSKTV
jgi:signal transduction histidine kinase